MESTFKGDTAKDTTGGHVLLEEWEGWGCMPPLPEQVLKAIENFMISESSYDATMGLDSNRAKNQRTSVPVDKKYKAKYQALGDSEKKLHFFTARQIACRLMGSRGYLCQKCWLPMKEDCMCLKVKTCSLENGIRFWLYMHPKDFLRQNNTGKLLLQVFGVQSVNLCLFGVSEHEETMSNAFKLAGAGKVWCLYPSKNSAFSARDIFAQNYSPGWEVLHGTSNCGTLNFVLIDGTWSNSSAMLRRLKSKMKTVWQDENLPCVSLSRGASIMHRLRSQPCWDRTCTAAAVIGLMSELQLLPELKSCEFDGPIKALEDALIVLLESLTTRRVRMGGSVTRKPRHSGDIC